MASPASGLVVQEHGSATPSPSNRLWLLSFPKLLGADPATAAPITWHRTASFVVRTPAKGDIAD